MSDEPLLDVPSAVEPQMKINGSGLDVIMAQMVLDVRYGAATVKHIHSSRVTEAMNGVDIFEALWGKGLFEIFPANAVNAMAGELFPSLIDKEPVLIRGLWGDTVFPDIELDKMTGLWFKLYKPEPISLSEDSESHFLRVKVV